jgi:hypothetical protein
MRMRAGVALLAVSCLAAACSSSNTPSGNGTSAPPRGLAGTPGSASASATASGSATPGRHRSASRTASGSASGSAVTATGAVHSTTPAAHRSTQPAPRTSAPHGSSSTKPAPSGPTVTVTPHTGLSNGRTVTVEGWHFKPNTTLAIAECRDRGADTNLSDCNINNVVTYAPGRKMTSDANGHVGPLQIRVNKTFKQVNCATEACLVAVSEPTLNPDPADEGDEYIHFV